MTIADINESDSHKKKIHQERDVSDQQKNDLAALFDAQYYATGCGEPYAHNKTWMTFFGQIANHIVAEIQPKTVMDAGCAMGFLVESLRERGVQAWGVDISSYAIQNVAPDMQPFCHVASIQDPFPQPHYDLIVCIEVLEHLPEDKADKTVANLCRHSDNILFSSTPYDNKEATHFNVQPPEYWVKLFLQHGFVYDVDYDASFIAPWAMRLCRLNMPVEQYLAYISKKVGQLNQVITIRRTLNLEAKNELIQKELLRAQLKEKLSQMATIRSQLEAQLIELEAQRSKLITQLTEAEAQRAFLSEQVANANANLSAVLNSRSWRFMWHIQRFRERIIPIGSKREVVMNQCIRGLRILRNEGMVSLLHRMVVKINWQAKVAHSKLRSRVNPPQEAKTIIVDDLQMNPPAQAHKTTVDLIICVHNAPADIRRCIDSVVEHTNQPYTLILVDDGSEEETREYLADFALRHQCQLIRNNEARGYTLAANQGLHTSRADFALLLNSDTIVTPHWIDRMVTCAQSDPQIGLVGPLSNCATWQSIPEIIANGEWAENPLPEDITVAQMGEWVAARSARLYPQMQFLNGFCLLIRRAVIEQIGYFDEETFGVGYGEENDYCLRARKQGWQLALADDAYVYHAHSRSYSSERRHKLSERANRALAKKHGQQIIDLGTADCRESRVLQGIRAHSAHFTKQEEIIQNGYRRFKNKRLVFVLPIWVAGGGGNVVVLAAQSMRRMGVDAQILNLPVHRASFEQAYPNVGVPLLYAEIEDIHRMVVNYDAAVGTFNPSISWIAPALEKHPDLKVGYYIQDYEPYFYVPGTTGHQIASHSYTLVPDLVRCVTTQWIYDQIQHHHRLSADQDLPCTIIGASFDTSLYWPRPRHDPAWPDRPIRISAMIRPHSERRSPYMTMEVLQQISREYGDQVEFKLFGTTLKDPGFDPLPKDFPWDLAGELRPTQVANLLNECEIFVDFSVFQGLGLTAMEAMSCGCAVIVPNAGGGSTFAVHEENCLVVDTKNTEACYLSLKRLIDDHNLRHRLQSRGISAALQFYPELPAYRLLDALFLE